MSGEVGEPESGKRTKRTVSLSEDVAARLDATVAYLHYTRRVPKGAAADLLIERALDDRDLIEEAAEEAGYPVIDEAAWPAAMTAGDRPPPGSPGRSRSMIL